MGVPWRNIFQTIGKMVITRFTSVMKRLIKRSHIWSEGALFVGLLILEMFTANCSVFKSRLCKCFNKVRKSQQLIFDSTMHDFK